MLEPPASPHSPSDFDRNDSFITEPVPVSGLAIAGLVLGIIFCLPVFSPLLALIFGVIGVIQIRAGKRRGMLVAALAIFFGLCSAVIQGGVTIFGYNCFESIVQMVDRTSGMLQDDGDALRAHVAAIRTELASDDFAAAVNEDQLIDWLLTLRNEIGGVQGLEPNGREWWTVSEQNQEWGRITWRIRGAQREVPFAIDFSFGSSGRAWIEDISFDGQSPRSDNDPEPTS